MGELIDPSPARDRITQGIADLFEFNQRVVGVLRQQATDFETLAALFENQKQRALMVHESILELMMIATANTGDILISEFGISISDEDEEEGAEDGTN